MIRFIEETGSTNADLAAACRSGDEIAEGNWLIARRQTAGRGRQGREWFDGAGNFMGSTLVRLTDNDPPPATLSFVAALAVSHSIAQTIGNAAPVRLKWPNDVLVNGGKASGILLEMVRGHVVVGIGVNLAKAPDLPDRKTSALANFAPAISPETFAERIAQSFANFLTNWRDVGFSATLREFLNGAGYNSRTTLTVHDTDGSHITGTFAGLDETDGALRLRLADGSERVIRAGDIS